MKQNADVLIINAKQLLTMIPSSSYCPDDAEARAVGAISDGALAIVGTQIVAVGTTEQIQDRYSSDAIVDASGNVVTPGFVDPHTHVVFGGSRHMEFGMRMVFGRVSTSASYIYNRHVVRESDIENGLFIPRLETNFEGVQFSLGMSF